MDLELVLLRYLQDRFGHVSWSGVVSRPGLNSIYEFLRGQCGKKILQLSFPVWLQRRDALYIRALELFYLKSEKGSGSNQVLPHLKVAPIILQDHNSVLELPTGRLWAR